MSEIKTEEQTKAAKDHDDKVNLLGLPRQKMIDFFADLE